MYGTDEPGRYAESPARLKRGSAIKEDEYRSAALLSCRRSIPEIFATLPFEFICHLPETSKRMSVALAVISRWRCQRAFEGRSLLGERTLAERDAQTENKLKKIFRRGPLKISIRTDAFNAYHARLSVALGCEKQGCTP